jgi:hypothetical protein
MPVVLGLVVGTLWTASYCMIIWKGFTDRTYGMPLVAVAANVSWEFIFTFVHPTLQPQRTVNLVWFILDFVILITVIRFGHTEFPGLPRWMFLGGLAATILTAYFGILFFAQSLAGAHAAPTAFAANLMMSALFLGMLYSRWRNRSSKLGPLRGQSALIGWTKLAGTACASFTAYVYLTGPYRDSPLLPFLYITTFLIDVIYVTALYAVKQSLHKTVAQQAAGQRQSTPGAAIAPDGGGQ